MNAEEKLEDCKFNLKQIERFNPDPYYLNYFLINFIQSVIEVYEKILQEANRDFGLFVDGKCTLEKFRRKAKQKDDELALKFSSWFNNNYLQEHETPYANVIKNIIDFNEQIKNLPKIKIKIIANQRYKDDLSQEIKVDLHNEKIRSKEDLELEIKKQRSIFLELINHKRKCQGEPKVSKNEIVASAFIEIENIGDFEILDVCESYLSVLNRFIKDSRNKIKQLTQ